MERPELKIELKPIDKATKLIGIIGLLVLVVVPIYFYGKLPDTIPIHYGANGDPDGFNDRESIWILPMLGIFMYFGLSALNKYPHIFNYPKKVTRENAEQLYTIGTRMMRTLNTTIVWIFAYITYSTIQTALGNQNGLGTWFTPIFMILIFGTTGYFLYKSMSRKS